MKLTAVHGQQLRRQTERILHVPGNFTGGILEMALITDGRLDAEEGSETVAELAHALKRQSEVFKNVRLNLVEWMPGGRPKSRVVPLSVLAMGGLGTEHVPGKEEPDADSLLSYLKVFQARSKLIVVLSRGGTRIEQEQICREALKPFLGRKLCWIALGEEPALGPFLEKERVGFLDWSHR